MKYVGIVNGQKTVFGSVPYEFAGRGAFDSLTDAERVPFGFYPATDVDPAPADSVATGFSIIIGTNSATITHVYTAKSAAVQCAEVDAAAEIARIKYCPVPLLSQEYKLAYDDVVTWLANQASPVPSSLQAWVTANQSKSWTPLQAANDIKAAGDTMTAKLNQIRSIRLIGKAAIVAGTSGASAVIAQLQAT